MTTLHDIFDTDTITEEDEATPTIGALTFTTPLLDLSFKAAEVGDNVVDAGRSYLAANIIDAAADKLVTQMAAVAVRLQIALEGSEAVANDTAKRPSEFFDLETGELLEEHKERFEVRKKNQVERDFAEMSAIWQTLSELASQRADKVRSRNPMQYGWISQDGAARSGLASGPITNAKVALQYRMATTPAKLTAKANAEQTKDVEIEDTQSSLAAAFG
jgi:hypothetical protein